MNPQEQFWRGEFEPAVNRTGRPTNVVKARVSPTVAEIHRAAAWWAGEGSVSSRGGHLSISIAQKEVAVMFWMLERFGGAFHMRKPVRHLEPVHYWTASGPRARGFLMTIYSCIPESPRRQEQIRAALAATAQIKKRGPKPVAICVRGHPKDRGRCLICQRAWHAKSRSIPENAERHRQRERERYARKVAVL